MTKMFEYDKMRANLTKGLKYLKMYKPYTKDEIINVDNEIRDFFNRNNIELKSGMDIIKVCKELGFKVFSLSLPDRIDGVILVNQTNKLIGISNKIIPQDARRVIAHELAHYIFESKKQPESEMLFAMKDSILHGDEKSAFENLMDLFAASILVPKEEFLKDIKKYQIKKAYTVDEAASKLSFNVVLALAEKYDVEETLILRRIAEVSHYA